MSIKVYINFEVQDHPIGGTNQFLRALKSGFQSMGVDVGSPDQADVLLFNSCHFVDKALNLKRKRPELLIIHRIDGPISLYNSPDDPRDAIIETANRFLADGTIFQSEWSRKENYRLGFPSSSYEAVIQNSTDPTIFNNTGKTSFSRLRKIRLIASSWSANWKKGFETYRWLDENLDFSKYEMTFVGNSPLTFHNIRHIAPLNSKDLANELRKHDIYIFASPIEACSNALLEALHCGLPVIARNGSSNKEVLGEGGEIFDDAQEVPKILSTITRNYYSYQKHIRVQSLNEVVNQYYKFLSMVHAEKIAGRYEAKKLTVFPEARLRMALLWWKFQGRIRGRLTRVKDVVLNRLSPKLLLRNR